jgi:hypothetical protein
LKILGAIAGVSLLFAGVAFAASLGTTTTGLAAGNATVSGCVSSPLTAIRTVDSTGNVTAVTVTNVPSACQNQWLSITLVGSGGASLGSGLKQITGCTSGCSIAFSGFGTVSAAALAGYAFAVRP